MRGSPLLRAVLAFIALALAGIPLWKLTRASEAVAVPAQQPVAVRGVTLALTFSTAPTRVAVLHLGKAVWEQDAPGIEAQKAVKIEYPPEGVDLQFNVAWPAAAGASALRVRLTDPDGTVHEKTVWGRDEMEEVLTFP